MDYQKLAADTGLILVEVDGSNVKQPRSVTSPKDGKQYDMPGTQTAFVWQGSKYPVEISIDWDSAKGPYRPGFYFLSGPIFASGNYGALSFKGSRELVLVECDIVLDSLALGAPKAKAA